MLPFSATESRAHYFVLQERSQTMRMARTIYPSPLSSTESPAHWFCPAKIPLTNNNRNAHKQQQDHPQARIVKDRPPSPSPPRNLNLTGFVLQKYRSQTATGHSQTATRTHTNKKSDQTVDASPLSSTKSQTHRFFLQKYRSQTTTGTLTNCNMNAHKQEE